MLHICYVYFLCLFYMIVLIKCCYLICFNFVHVFSCKGKINIQILVLCQLFIKPSIDVYIYNCEVSTKAKVSVRVSAISTFPSSSSSVASQSEVYYDQSSSHSLPVFDIHHPQIVHPPLSQSSVYILPTGFQSIFFLFQTFK